MKKDLESFYRHDKDYGDYFDLEKSKKVAEGYERNNFFETGGFKRAVENIGAPIKTHIDVGSGTGWLLLHTSPLFERVIGIEPSKKAIEIAEKILEERNVANALFINKDMIDAFSELKPEEPVFVSTAIVLSHIKDFYVKEFLRIMDGLPNDSVLYFDEPYEKNIQQKLWHIRSKKWWAKNLENWNLTFWDIDYGEYRRGIFGIRKGKEQVQNTYRKSPIEEIGWFFGGLWNKVKAIGRKLNLTR